MHCTNEIESVRLLLDAGADADLRNNKREQALNMAELADQVAIIELLRKHKKDNKLFGIF